MAFSSARLVGALRGRRSGCAHLCGAWALLPLLTVPLAWPQLTRVLTAHGASLNPALGGTARLQLVFGLLFALGLALR